MENVLRAIQEAPWAVREETLAMIVEIVEARAAGAKLSAEEIQARIGGPGAGPRASYRVGAIAVLPLFGVIFPRANLMTAVSGATSLQVFEAAFQDALEDRGTEAILIDVDSPGGTIDLVPEAAARLRAARGRKPIWAIANTHADSAAYWLASQAERVLVTPSGELGGIGVFAAHQDRSGMEERAGVKTTLIASTSARFKTERSPFAPLSEEARAEIQRRVDVHDAMFVSDVARGRGVSAATVRSADWGHGRALDAKRAVDVGMADEVATFEQALARLSKTPPVARTPVAPTSASAQATDQSQAELLVREHAELGGRL